MPPDNERILEMYHDRMNRIDYEHREAIQELRVLIDETNKKHEDDMRLVFKHGYIAYGIVLALMALVQFLPGILQ